MDTTRASLLIRIRDTGDSHSWKEFHDIYAPLLYRYARSRGVSHVDAEEIRSSCFETIFTHIQDFTYVREKGGFKGWLRRMVVNRVIDMQRKRRVHQADSHELNRIETKERTPEEAFDDQWKLTHLEYCLEHIKSIVATETYQAFELLASKTSVEEVCSQLELNPNQVYKAKSKVLQLVKEQMRLVYGDEMD